MNTKSSGFLCFFYSISACSLCLCVLRKKCQVLEKKYFSPFMDLKFYKCSEFEKLDFTIGVNCDMVEHLNTSLKEVPLETDWLCLTKYQGITIEAESFSQLTNLKALYILGNFEILPRSFIGLSQLSTLWLESEYTYGNITIHKDSFVGLQELQELKISRVPFYTLESSIFEQLHQVEHLILELNKITYFSTVTKSLIKMKRLQKLSIINNDIETLKESDCLLSECALLDGLFLEFNISYLDLSLNDLHIVENNSLCNFPHLKLFKADKSGIDMTGILQSGIKTSKVVLLSNRFFRSLDICKLVFHFQVKHLLIMFNDLLEMSTSRGSCKNLVTLDVSNNYLKEIHFKPLKKLNRLIELNLFYNEIAVLNICSNETIHVMKLIYLNVSFNYLTNLQGGQFRCLRSLQVLTLDHNHIYVIKNLAFEGLHQLKVLNLQNNNLFEIDQFTFSILLSLTHLNLYGNSIVHFDQSAFSNLHELQEIKLTFENILDRYLWPQYIATSVKKIFVKSNIKYIELVAEYLNAFSVLESLEVDSHSIFIDPCNEFVFTRLKELHLKNNLFITCFGTGKQALENFTNLENLSYSANSQSSPGIVSLNSSLQHLKKLNFFRLQDTDKLMESGQINVYDLFHGLSHLKVLHLINSGIERLDLTEIFSDLQELEFLVIENQNMQEVKENVFASMPNLKYIYFVDTTFPCNCKFNWLLSWLESGTSVSIINFHEQECYMNIETYNLVSFLNTHCQTGLDFTIFVTTFMFTLLFMCMSLFYESIWWHILYMFFTVRCWLNHRHRAKDHYEYDAFVSYNSHNELWVTEQLLPNLEQNGPSFFKMCIHSRDFQVGRDIVENIMDSIYNSRWTICLITRSYLQSNWCSLEMRLATYRLVEESKDSLILIFLDKISREELHHYHKLTKLLDKKTYLNWPDDINGQQLFWARLHKVIGESGRKRK
ncbi:uncharacterized protein LOC142160251 [Mixophyes fleayi]|uniref:uncharacterized protein LOC142160251 n=1 Tax=Mixophyes fleayi TaxID=3061075 RepID=UPI003F4DACD1